MSKTAFKRIFLGLLALYVVMFAARAVYDLITFQDSDIATSYNVYYDGEKSVRNYASQQLTTTGKGEISPASGGVLDQKYERIANITSKSTRFDQDMEQFRSLLEDNAAVIQMENSRGLEGGRRVDLVIGVRPENFDAMHAAILQIGRVTSSTATITDKTYEYREMLAELETLQRQLASYEELKELSGSIPELMKLQETIILVEADIQRLMVSLGEYGDDNALCTINFSLYEGSEASVARKLWNALTWTTGTYLLILLLLLFVGFVAFVLAALWRFLRKTLTDKPEGPKAPAAPYGSGPSQPPQPPGEKSPGNPENNAPPNQP